MTSFTALTPARKFYALIALFIMIAYAGHATAQVGLTKQQVQKDVSQKLAEATGSMLRVKSMKLLSSRETSKGRYEIDIEMTVSADERAMESAIARSKANRLASNWKEEAARVERMALDARKKDGLTENIKAVYQLSRAGTWELSEVSDNTSDYTRRRNQNGENSAPEEAQVVAEFESLIKLLSNDVTSISRFVITNAEAMRNNQVKLSIQMSMKSAENPAKNGRFARQVNGLTNVIEVIYQRDSRGNWHRVQ